MHCNSAFSLSSLLWAQKTCCHAVAFLESLLQILFNSVRRPAARPQKALSCRWRWGGCKGEVCVCLREDGVGHDTAAAAAGSPACRGHLITMDSLPPGASDLGQASPDKRGTLALQPRLPSFSTGSHAPAPAPPLTLSSSNCDKALSWDGEAGL